MYYQVSGYSFSTLKILATVKHITITRDNTTCFSTLKILATVKLVILCVAGDVGFSTLKILAYKYEMISNDQESSFFVGDVGTNQ